MNQEAGQTAREESSSTPKAGILRLQAGEHVTDLSNATAGPERLILVTCGGPYIDDKVGYRDNIIFTAHPE